MHYVLRYGLSALGLTSAGMGLLSLMPRLSARTWLTQMALSEFPALPIGVGGLVAWAGWRAHVQSAFMFGAAGALMSAHPLRHVRNAHRNMKAEMQAMLGRRYETQIQHAALARCQKYPWSLRRTFNAHRVGQYKVTVDRDVVYCERPTRALKADIYRPAWVAPDHGPLPAIIVLHPGAWSSGDKSWVFTPHDMTLAQSGYVVIDIQYRFINETGWPGQMDDCREAIRWVRRNAAQLGVDPKRIALLGRSSGGHVALSTAFRATGEHADTRVSAVIGIYAPSNLTMVGEKVDPRVEKLMGGDLDAAPEQYIDASPITHAGPECPPTLLVHGQKDRLVYAINSEMLRWTLRRHGVPVALLRIPWGHHAFDGPPGGLGTQLAQYHIDRFLAWSLYHEQ